MTDGTVVELLTVIYLQAQGRAGIISEGRFLLKLRLRLDSALMNGVYLSTGVQ